VQIQSFNIGTVGVSLHKLHKVIQKLDHCGFEGLRKQIKFPDGGPELNAVHSMLLEGKISDDLVEEDEVILGLGLWELGLDLLQLA
jgi:hypothetical protein